MDCQLFAQQTADAFLTVFDAGGLLTFGAIIFGYLAGALNPWLDRWLDGRFVSPECK